MSNVKLAVRVRPFTEKETRCEKARVPVVDIIDDNTVAITNIKVSLSGAGDSRERTRSYYADYTFDSSCASTQANYASQSKIFEGIGISVISSVSQGCSACVLAYGQSATGKTYTMMGTEAQPGLVPRICKALFEQQQENSEYTISFLEIYNERVHDLLCTEAPLPTCHSLPRLRGNARKDLRVREHPQRGTYVQNLRRVIVHNVESLLALVAEGIRRRRTASTKRNTTSSRSHAILEIRSPHATLHLADLAGSEKASWDGCRGSRQKEGANINKSLVALSNVISALVSGGAGRGRFVPYRDSALTWLLKDCFTGGANTFIIATVSPSAACYGESASTLRWAARARQLPTPRALNHSTGGASRAALQAQFNQLIVELTTNHIRYNPDTGKLTFDDIHWQLKNDCSNAVVKPTVNTTASIGNIMNLMRPKTDANNSESTTSSVASGSSDVINAIDKNTNIRQEINTEIDNIFGRSLERAGSSDELKVMVPLRHKRRQCRSQEVLTIDESPAVVETSSLTNNKPSQSDIQINKINCPKQKIPHITVLHENQRAEIVASVTERLYSKLKKKEEAAVSKVESIVERKIVEPLNELKICTNARQRLMELSQKAIRNRRRIGIPAYTQTKKVVTRVKDQATDVQTDLHYYLLDTKCPYVLNKDVATETVPITARCKEVAVGPTSALNFTDRSTGTNQVICKNSFMMTDFVVKSENSTQTRIIPPPRRKKCSSKHVCKSIKGNNRDEYSTPPVVSIHISQSYPTDSETQSSEDSSEKSSIKNNKAPIVPTPDLLTNHNTAETPNIIEVGDKNIILPLNSSRAETTAEDFNDLVLSKLSEDFPDTDNVVLPRVCTNNVNRSEIKNMILGRSKENYPYNIVISPSKERGTKRLVKFEDIDMAHSNMTDLKRERKNSSLHTKNCSSPEPTAFESDNALVNDTNSDSTESSKQETDSFIWKKGIENDTLGSLRRNYVPVFKGSKHKMDMPQMPQFTSPDNINNEISSDDSNETTNTVGFKFRRRRINCNENADEFNRIERKIHDSCNNLEESVRKYENYAANTKKYMNTASIEPPLRRPKEYLQHLVQLRRDFVKTESENTDSSTSISRI